MKRKSIINIVIKAFISVVVLKALFDVWIDSFQANIERVFRKYKVYDIFRDKSLLIVLIVCILGGSLLTWLLKRNRYTRYAGISAAIIMLIMGIRSEGFFPFVDCMVTQINNYYLKNYELFLNENSSKGSVMLFLMTFGSIVFAVLLYGSLTKRKIMSVLAGLSMLIPLAICVYCGVMPDSAVGLFYMISVACYFLYKNIDETSIKKEYFLTTAAAVILVTASVAVHYRIYDYSENHKLDLNKVNKKIAKIEEDISKGEFDKALQEIGLKKWKSKLKKNISKGISDSDLMLPGGIGGVGTPGDISNLSKRTKSNKVRLEIRVDREPEKNIYLKSFAAIEADENVWKEVDSDAYSINFRKDYLMPFDEIEFYHDKAYRTWEAKMAYYLQDSESEWDMQELKDYVEKVIYIRNIDEEEDRVFEPYYSYNTYSWDDQILDLYCDAFYRVSKDYIYYAKTGDISFLYFDKIPEKILQEYDNAFSKFIKYKAEVESKNLDRSDSLELFDEYANDADYKTRRDMEYLRYLWEDTLIGVTFDGSDDLKDAIRERIGDEHIEWGSVDEFWDSYYRIKNKIEGELYTDFKYTLNPGETPKGQNPLLYFLQENKKGFCVHYASISTLAFQEAGIPSRYVEGYVVSPDAFKKDEDGMYVAKVTDDMGHAWCEVYGKDGWSPVETTPYYNEEGRQIDAGLAEQRQKMEDIYLKSTIEDESQTKNNTDKVSNEITTSEKKQAESDKQGDKKSDSGKKEMSKQVVLALKITLRCLVIGLVFIAIWLQALIRKKARYNNFKKYKNNKSIVKMYNAIIFLCEYAYGLKLNNVSDEESYLKMKESVPNIEETEWDWMYKVANEIVFYTRESDKETNKRFYTNLVDIRKQAGERINWGKRLMLYLIFAI